MFQNPSVAEFKSFFVRDFPYGTDPAVSVIDSDISRAFITANGINPGFYDDQGAYAQGYLLLAAHALVLNMRASSQGLASSFNFMEQSKSVGAVSQSFAIPQSVMENPEWAMLASTAYGAQYLSAILPQMAGQVFAVAGSTRP